jgi:hypothetical protein
MKDGRMHQFDNRASTLLYLSGLHSSTQEAYSFVLVEK